jgi:hypothetical protein
VRVMRKPYIQKVAGEQIKMELDKIHWHDCVIKRVVELPAEDRLLFEVDYPVDWDNQLWELRTIVFGDVYTYEIHEGPFAGSPTILDATAIATDQQGVCVIKVETNAGYRMVKCMNVSLSEDKICCYGLKRIAGAPADADC